MVLTRHPVLQIWELPASGVLEADLTTPVVTFTAESRASVGGVKFHPSAQGVVAFYAHKELHIGDIEAQTLCFQNVQAPGDNLCSLAWSYDGSLLLTASLDKQVRLADPRVAGGNAMQTEAHTGRRQASVAWCGRLEHFVTAGSDRMQERELKLWDPRNLSKHVHRQRLDSSIGQLFPLYDDDLNLLYLLGRGDRSVRSFEVDLSRGSAAVQALDHSVLANMTFAVAMVPKQACATASCEVARLLNLSTSGGGVCDVLSFQVPRKDAAHSFQSDLYPDTKAFEAALTADEWKTGRNAEPILERVAPTSAKSAAPGASSVFGVSQWSTPPPAAATAATAGSVSSGNKLASWGSSWSSTPAAPSPAPAPATASASSPAAPAPAQPPAPVAPSGWGASTTAWSNAVPAPSKRAEAVPAWKATASVPQQLPQWQNALPTAWGSLPTPEEAPALEQENVDNLSDKARRLGSKYGHKVRCASLDGSISL